MLAGRIPALTSAREEIGLVRLDDKRTAGFQYAPYFAQCPMGIGKEPEQAHGEHQVEAGVRHGQGLVEVVLQELDLQALGFAASLRQHTGGEIHRAHPCPGRREPDAAFI